MRTAAFLAALALAAAPVLAVPPADPDPLPGARLYEVLPPGRYAVSVTGMVSTVCARAIAAEWSKLPEVESASADFAHSSAVVVVRIDAQLKVSALRKALMRAERVADLGGDYEIKEIAYRTR